MLSMVSNMDNRCLYCNEIIPEGRLICPDCEKYYSNKIVCSPEVYPTGLKQVKKIHNMYYQGGR